MTVEAKIESLESLVISLKAQYESALETIAKQAAEIADLKAQLLSKNLVKSSQNSHLPPSVDLTRKNQSLREKSDKPVGGQIGHKGHTLEMTQTPDKKVPLYPDFCNSCGRSLSGSDFTLVSRRQVIDIPPIIPTTTEYQNYATMCTCGHHQKGSFPQGVASPVQYGENIQSLVVYQSCYQFMPFGRLQDFFKKVCQVDISKGTIENILRRTAHKSQGTYDALRQVIVLSFFVGSDETGFKLKGTKGWFWVWQNAVVTFIVAATSRSKQVIAEHFPQGLPNSILGSDRLAAQLSTISKGAQLCLAHLLRDLNYLIGVDNTEWAIAFKQLLKDAIALKQIASHYEQNDEKVLDIQQRADKLLNETILNELLVQQQETKEKTKNAHTLVFLRAMIKYRHALFEFLYHPLVPFDNNGSERAIRMLKVKIKISGQFKSLHQEFAIIRSIIDTAIKNGKPVFDAIKAMVALTPDQKVAG